MMNEIINKLYDLIYKESSPRTLKDYFKKNNHDFKKIIKYCLKNQENSNALIILAKFEKDKIKAFKYYKKAAELKNVEGLFQTGYCYRFGFGIDEDIDKAIIYFNASVILEHPKASFLIGLSYDYG